MKQLTDDWWPLDDIFGCSDFLFLDISISLNALTHTGLMANFPRKSGLAGLMWQYSFFLHARCSSCRQRQSTEGWCVKQKTPCGFLCSKNIQQTYSFVTVYCMNLLIFLCVIVDYHFFLVSFKGEWVMNYLFPSCCTQCLSLCEWLCSWLPCVTLYVDSSGSVGAMNRTSCVCTNVERVTTRPTVRRQRPPIRDDAAAVRQWCSETDRWMLLRCGDSWISYNIMSTDVSHLHFVQSVLSVKS